MSQRYAEFILIVLVFLCLAGPAHAEQVTITGQVLGPEGEAVAEAEVFVLYRSPEVRWPFAVKQRQSDADGRFSFSFDTHKPDRAVQVGALKEGFALDWGRVEAGGEIALKLGANAVTCRGTVTDAQGNPIEGVEVAIGTLKRLAESGTWQHLVFAEAKLFHDITDKTGRFEFAGLSAEAGLSLVAQAEGWATRVIGNVMPPTIFAREQDIELILHPAATISGCVTDDGQPVGGVRVAAQGVNVDGWAEDVSGEDGRYKLAGLPGGTYNVMIYDAPEGLTAAALEGVTVKSGEHLRDADIELTPGGLVQGTVTEAETDQAIAGAHIGAHGPARPESSAAIQSATADEAGRYTLRLPGGKNMLYYAGRAKGFPYALAQPQRHWIDVVEGETVTGVDFVLRRAPRLRGQVLLPDGQPAAGAELGVVAQFSGPSRQDFFSARADEEGNFDIEALVVIRYTPRWIILARDSKQYLTGWVLMDDSGKPVQIRMAKGSYLTAAVVDTEGNALSDARVELRMTYGNVGSRTIRGLRSDKMGRLRIGPLPANLSLRPWLVGELSKCLLDDTWKNIEQVSLAPGEERELPPLRLSLRGRAVRGWVGNEQGEPVAGARIYGTGAEKSAVSGEDGYFELTGLKAHGMVCIVAVHPTKPRFAVEETDPDWGFRPGLILRPLGSATGQVVDEQGQAIQVATVAIRWDFRYSIPAAVRTRLGGLGFLGEIRTDADGRWSVEGLIAGINYEVPVFPPEKRGGRTLAEFTAKGGETVDLGELVLKQTEE